MNDLQKQQVQAAIIGFNFGMMGYMLIRYLPIFLAGRNVGWDWFITQLLIGLVVGLVVAAVGYVVMGVMQK